MTQGLEGDRKFLFEKNEALKQHIDEMQKVGNEVKVGALIDTRLCPTSYSVGNSRLVCKTGLLL